MPPGDDPIPPPWRTVNALRAVLVGTVALTAAGIVIAAAFATGARRQLTTVGLLSANGAPPAMIRRVLFLQGAIAGAAGSLVGLGLAAAVLVGLSGRLDLLFLSTTTASAGGRA